MPDRSSIIVTDLKTSLQAVLVCIGRELTLVLRGYLKTRKVIIFSLYLMTLFAGVVFANEQTFYFDIPEQRADDALILLGQQADVTVLFQYDMATQYDANRLQGEYTLPQAIAVLLARSGLKAIFGEQGHLIISIDDSQGREQVSQYKHEKKDTKKSILAAVTAALLSVFTPVAVTGQATENTASTVLEEIIVTASKRGAVSVQDIAGSIQAISAQTLERTRVEGIEDYIKMVPGLTSVSSGPGQTQIVIRGVNANRIAHNAPQKRALAGIYVDETPISLTGFNPDLGIVDIERIEVLRGPQGTLYGGSSMSGTIRIITKQPDTEKFTGRLSTDTSFTKDGDMNYGFKGSANIPISDRFAMRVSGYYMEKGGYVDNVDAAAFEEDYNDEETIGGKVQLAYLGDVLNVTATVMYNEMEADGRPDEYLPPSTTDTALVMGALAPITNELQTVKAFNDNFTNEFSSANITINYDFENVKLTSSSSYFHVDVLNRLDDSLRTNFFFPGLTFVSDLINTTSYNTKVQEIRLSSTYESSLQWIIGGFYESNRTNYTTTDPTTSAFLNLNDLFGAGPNDMLFGAAPNSLFDSTDKVKSEQFAIFGNASYNFTDALKLTLGFRWFDYKNDVFITASGLVNGGVSVSQDTIKESDWVPKVELTYDITDDHMVYASYSEGYRLGGVNDFVPATAGTPPVSCADELNALGTAPGSPFTSDSLKSYEIGAKTSWLDNRLTANVALFFAEFEGIQSTVSLACGFSQQVNAGTVENIGFEGDLTFQASEALMMRFGFTYVDAEVTSAVAGLNAEDDAPPYVPEFSASGSIEYGVPIWNGFGFIRGDIRYVSSSNNEFSSLPTVLELDDYTIVDLTVGYEFNTWEFSLFSKNLFDDKIITNIDPDRVQPAQYSRGRPRTVGISVSKNF